MYEFEKMLICISAYTFALQIVSNIQVVKSIKPICYGTIMDRTESATGNQQPDTNHHFQYRLCHCWYGIW